MKQITLYALLVCLVLPAYSTQLQSIQPLDESYLHLVFQDGEVEFVDDAQAADAYENYSFHWDKNALVEYGNPLNVNAASQTNSWRIKSTTDAAYGTTGSLVQSVSRKSKIDAMSQETWNTSENDWNYDIAFQHQILLKLPSPLKPGHEYQLEISSSTESQKLDTNFRWMDTQNVSEAIHVNLNGYDPSIQRKAVDLYAFLGNAGRRDYKEFEGNKVYLVSQSGQETEVGQVEFWKSSQTEAQWYNLTGGDVWRADIVGFTTPGKYRVRIEGVGMSPEFEIDEHVYKAPFDVSVKGFFYMRIGQDSPNLTPVPRKPLWIPGVSPAQTKVVITTMHPHHPNWGTFASGDAWDKPTSWAAYVKPGSPENPRATGGHSDALDWDRHLGHISIIWDMLLPYILTEGSLADDNVGIAESGNGIPDLLDEARNEVDFWLNLRDGAAYSHGLTNPDGNDVLYQAGTTGLAAWSAALNASMMAHAFQLSSNSMLQQEYLDSAEVAYQFADNLSDPMLNTKHPVGMNHVTGGDLKMMAAAHLYHLTGNQSYENDMAALSRVNSNTSQIDNVFDYSQLWGVAAYLHTNQTIHYPELQAQMKASIIHQAMNKESNYSALRPSRRSTDNNTGYFQTIQNVQRSLVAHSVATGAQKDQLHQTLTYEADWGLGRNPMNVIQMTTATTTLAKHRSFENIYTSGRDDGSPGLHPGHTPYINHDDWGSGMITGRPTWMLNQMYPALDQWPKASGFIDTRYVWAHTEFTPQQTMRGKMALYAYLYGLNRDSEDTVTLSQSQPKVLERNFEVQLTPNGYQIETPLQYGEVYQVRLYDIQGQVHLSDQAIMMGKLIEGQFPSNLRSGTYLLEVRSETESRTLRLVKTRQ